MPPHVQVRLLGGFQVQSGTAEPGKAFESQKVRALLAYLACHPGQAFTREQLSELLWPDENSSTGRHNLRQALYSLRRGLGARANDLVVSEHGSLGFVLGRSDRVDVADLEAAYHRGFPAHGEPAPLALARVTDLYLGDFLSGFAVRDSAPFEDWLLTEQARLRDMAMQALSGLVDHFSTRGEYEQAITHCHRLLEIDPLSEEAHHELIRHYLLSGQRNRALRHYRDLEELLERELGVPPPATTRALYEGVQRGDGAFEAPTAAARPRLTVAPFIPLVGRQRLLRSLERDWRAALEDGARLMLLDGEPGIGRTRLARTALDHLSTKRRTAVAQGRCTGPAPWSGGHPLSTILRELPEAETDDEAENEDDATLEALLLAALERYFTIPGQGAARRPPPLALFLDDLHLAADSTFETLGRILDHFATRPLWVLATVEMTGLPADHPMADLVRRSGVSTERLERLGDDELGEIVSGLVGEARGRDELLQHLMVASEGLPLAATEVINALWDLGALTNHGGQWHLEGIPEPAMQATEENLRRLVLRRVAELPTSTRRLLTLAAVIGVTFDVGLLQNAAREHIGVVEIGLETLLEHSFIRHYARRWHPDPRERDLVLWAQGARRGTFEFAHPRIREAIYEDLQEERRRILHGDIARTLAERRAPPDQDDQDDPELPAFHFLTAGEWRLALPFLRHANEGALARGQADAAEELAGHGLRAAQRAEETEEKIEDWRSLLERCREARAEPLVAE